MGKEQLKSKIEEQQAVYQALKAGNADTVRYKEFHNGEWGTDDENYSNRLRRRTSPDAAAKAMDDPYGKRLEQEYESFLASFRR